MIIPESDPIALEVACYRKIAVFGYACVLNAWMSHFVNEIIESPADSHVPLNSKKPVSGHIRVLQKKVVNEKVVCYTTIE